MSIRRAKASSFHFKRKTKSDLGWAFIGLIDGGRIKEYADDGADITRIYRHQLAACTYEVLPGPGSCCAGASHPAVAMTTCSSARPSPRGWMRSTGRIGLREVV